MCLLGLSNTKEQCLDIGFTYNREVRRPLCFVPGPVALHVPGLAEPHMPGFAWAITMAILLSTEKNRGSIKTGIFRVVLRRYSQKLSVSHYFATLS